MARPSSAGAFGLDGFYLRVNLLERKGFHFGESVVIGVMLSSRFLDYFE